jgi:hypothetical protein
MIQHHVIVEALEIDGANNAYIAPVEDEDEVGAAGPSPPPVRVAGQVLVMPSQQRRAHAG